MIWRTSIPWLMIAAFIACALALVTESHASMKRYQVAKSYIGLKEGTRSANRAMGVNTRSTPWCGYFIRKTVIRSGQKPVKGYASASSWERFGRGVRLSQARKGDIVVVYSKYSRSRRHVGIFSHKSKGRVCIISGNSRNMVRTGCYSPKSVRKVRR